MPITIDAFDAPNALPQSTPLHGRAPAAVRPCCGATVLIIRIVVSWCVVFWSWSTGPPDSEPWTRQSPSSERVKSFTRSDR
ncbi:MAG: hypothetical protein ACK5CE_12715 [Actinomycetes bacterium]